MNNEDLELARAIEAKLKELNELLQSAYSHNLHVELNVDGYHFLGKAEPFSTVRVKVYRTLLDSSHA